MQGASSHFLHVTAMFRSWCNRSIFIRELRGLYAFSLFIAHINSQVPQPVHFSRSAAINWFLDIRVSFTVCIFNHLKCRFLMHVQWFFCEYFPILIHNMDKSWNGSEKYGDYIRKGIPILWIVLFSKYLKCALSTTVQE